VVPRKSNPKTTAESGELPTPIEYVNDGAASRDLESALRWDEYPPPTASHELTSARAGLGAASIAAAAAATAEDRTAVLRGTARMASTRLRRFKCAV
jgi:hypothetical protein